MALKNWVVKFNNKFEKSIAPQLSLLIFLIEKQTRPSPSACVDLATLLSLVTELHAQNFVVVFNKCPKAFTIAKAIDFFKAAVETLQEEVQKTIVTLTEQQILLI